LRDGPFDAGVGVSALPLGDVEPAPAIDSLRELARERRPDVAEAAAMESAAGARASLAKLASKPELSLGGFYEAMDLGRRTSFSDEAGVVVGITLPLRQERIAAGVA